MGGEGLIRLRPRERVDESKQFYSIHHTRFVNWNIIHLFFDSGNRTIFYNLRRLLYTTGGVSYMYVGGRVSQQLSVFPHRLCALFHQLLSDLIVYGFKTNIYQCRLAVLSEFGCDDFCHLNLCYSVFPMTTLSEYDILPHHFIFLKSSTSAL